MIKAVKRDEKGFTLVELVIVIAILAVLATLLVPKIVGNVEDAKKSKALADARTIASEITTHNAMEKTKDDPQYIPATLPEGNDTTKLTAANYNNTFGKLPDENYCYITVDSQGNAEVVIVGAEADDH